ncbi:MAG: carboxypeptidase regulatory-like domain-containing protein [Desulfovibrio sp.]
MFRPAPGKRTSFCVLICTVLLVFFSSVSPAQDTVLRRGDSTFSRDVMLADAAKYLQLSTDGVDQTIKFWTSFQKSLPESADQFKNALTILVLVDTMISGPSDPQRYQKALKTVIDFGAGTFATAYENAGYMPLATVNTLFTLYNESLLFFRDRVFLPGLADQYYDVYKSHRLGSGLAEHETAWSLTKIPEPVVADVALNVVLKEHGVQPGLYEGLKFDKEHLAKAARSASGKAAGRTIVVDARPGNTFSGHAFLINRDISQRIEIIAGFVQGYESQILSIMNTLSSRDLEQRKDADKTGYKPLSASDDKAVEAEVRLLFERLKTMDMGEKLRQEAMNHIGNTYRVRYEQEQAERVLRERATVARKVLADQAAKLRAFSRVRLITVRGPGPDGTPVPLEEAALFVDGKLCLSKTNGGLPCSTNRIGLAALHLPPGGHDVQARAPGYKPAEVRVFSDTPDSLNTSPDEYELLLEPDQPRDFAVRVTSGEDGPPLSGARLTLLLPGGGQMPAVTDATGLALFQSVPPAGPYRISAQAEAHTSGDFSQLSLDEDPTTLSLEPYRTTVTVQCLDLDGRPLPGATVRLGDHELTADAQGQVMFENMRPSPVGGYALTGTAQGLPPVGRTLEIRPVSDGGALHVELPFKVLTGILVVVRDADKRLVPNAEVVVDGADGPSRHRTDANGYVRLQDVGLGGHYLRAEAPGFPPTPDQEVLVSVEQPMHKVRLELRTGLEVKILVLGPDGSPVTGAKVTLDNGKERSAPSGSVVFEAVEPGKHVFIASTDLGQGRLECDIPASGPVPTLQLRLQPQGGSLLVQVRSQDGRPLAGATVVLLKNSKPYGQKSGSDCLFENLPEGYYNAEVSLNGYSPANSDSVLINTVSPRRTIAFRLTQEPDPVAARGTLRHMLKDKVEGNTYQYSGIALDIPGGPSRKIAFSQETKASVLSAFCATVNGVPAAKQRMPHVGSTAGQTYDLSGRLICDGKAQGGVTCDTYMSITCVVEPECKPGDPKCDPNAAKDPASIDTPKPGRQWTHASSGRDGPYRTFRHVKLNGSVVSASDKSAPNLFCLDRGLAPTVPQPVANIQNWQGALVDTNGNVVCKTRNAGGDQTNCRGWAAISCNEAPQPGADAPCDPNDALCGMDVGL